MPSPSAIAANLSCLLYLARHHPKAESELKEAVRVFLEALHGKPLTIDASLEWLVINRARMPSGTPGVREAGEQLLVHGVSRLELPADPDPASVLTLVRTLSAYAGAYGSWEDLIGSLGEGQGGAVLSRSGDDLTFVHI
ncbi:MAG: hypothetical protein E4H38_06520, partial [Gemmatimonadales bacterium]